MCTLAPRAAAAPGPGFGAANAFLDRHRGVVAAAMAPARNAGEPTRRARATEASVAAPAARKRGRHDGGFEHAAGAVIDPAAASSSSALRSRMDKELVALQGLIKRAKLLPRSAPPTTEKKQPVPAQAPAPRRSEQPPVVSSAVKRTTTTSQSQPKAATEAAPACRGRITAPLPAANSNQQQQSPVQRAAASKNPIAPEVPNKQRPAEAPAAAKPQQQRPVVPRAAAAAAAANTWNSAAASVREEFRRMLVEMEKAAMPDQTVYPEEMAALGIPFEFVTTRTWKQAMLEDYGIKV